MNSQKQDRSIDIVKGGKMPGPPRGTGGIFLSKSPDAFTSGKYARIIEVNNPLIKRKEESLRLIMRMKRRQTAIGSGDNEQSSNNHSNQAEKSHER